VSRTLNPHTTTTCFMALIRSITVAEWVYVHDHMSKGLKILSLGVIIMKSKTPEKFEKLLPNDYWLLVPWRFYAWHPHHTSRDRSRFLRMMLFINNTKNTFYETKVLNTKHVSFFKYIYKLIMLYWFSTGHSDQCHWDLPVQHEIYRSRSVGPVPISTTINDVLTRETW
jgi:hypothetical protein